MDARVDCSFMPTFSWGVNNGSCRTRTDRARTPADLPRAGRTQFKPAQYTCGVARVTEEGRLDYGGYGQQCKQGHVTRTVGFLPERKKKEKSSNLLHERFGCKRGIRQACRVEDGRQVYAVYMFVDRDPRDRRSNQLTFQAGRNWPDGNLLGAPGEELLADPGRIPRTCVRFLRLRGADHGVPKRKGVRVRYSDDVVVVGEYEQGGKPQPQHAARWAPSASRAVRTEGMERKGGLSWRQRSRPPHQSTCQWPTPAAFFPIPLRLHVVDA
jgi:hypothetical protein